MKVQTKNILVVKETRAEEKRVSLIPPDIEKLITMGCAIFVEHNAGKAAGFSDEDYMKVGATIRYVDDDSNNPYADLFSDINIIVRAKRPARSREILENKVIESGTIMIGALDPLERNSAHINEYAERKIVAHSIDQLQLPQNDPMNLLAAMSKMAGKLALQDAIKKFSDIPKKIVLIGFGTVGRSAFFEALGQGLDVTVVARNDKYQNEIENAGGHLFIMDNAKDIVSQQKLICDLLFDADIVITSARRSNEVAPILIPRATLAAMKPGAVVVDMALSEGGNVEGSEHDATLKLENNVIVTNISGYPKYHPAEASELWSQATRLYIEKMLSD